MQSSRYRTRPVHTGHVRREVCKNAGALDSHHRTLPKRLVLSVRNTYWRQVTPDAWTGSSLRPVLSVRCSTLTSLDTDSTPDTQAHRLVPANWASGECSFREKHSSDFSKLSTGAIENMHFILVIDDNPFTKTFNRNLKAIAPPTYVLRVWIWKLAHIAWIENIGVNFYQVMLRCKEWTFKAWYQSELPIYIILSTISN